MQKLHTFSGREVESLREFRSDQRGFVEQNLGIKDRCYAQTEIPLPAVALSRSHRRQSGQRTVPTEISSLRSDISAACGGLCNTKENRNSSELGAGFLSHCGGDEIRTRGTVTRTAV